MKLMKKKIQYKNYSLFPFRKKKLLLFPLNFVRDVVNLVTFTLGITVGWPVPILPKLQSNESPLPGEPLTLDEISWIASVVCIGGLVGNVFFGFAMNVFGRKKTLLFTAIPAIVSILYADIENFTGDS